MYKHRNAIIADAILLIDGILIKMCIIFNNLIAIKFITIDNAHESLHHILYKAAHYLNKDAAKIITPSRLIFYKPISINFESSIKVR